MLFRSDPSFPSSKNLYNDKLLNGLSRIQVSTVSTDTSTIASSSLIHAGDISKKLSKQIAQISEECTNAESLLNEKIFAANHILHLEKQLAKNSPTTQKDPLNIENDSSKKMLSNKNTSSEFIQRLKAFQAKKVSKLNNAKIDSRNKESHECSFKPNINEKGALKSIVGVTERLYNKDPKKNQFQQLYKDLKECEINRECTFSPTVYSRNSKSKYMKTNPIYSTTAYLNSAMNDSEFTFHPAINKTHEKQSHNKKDLCSDVYRRLSQSYDKINHISNQREKSCTTTSSSRTNEERSKIINEFNDRQRKYEIIKNVEKKRIKDENYIEPNPKINKKSKEITKNLDNFEKRNKLFMMRTKNRKMTSEKELRTDITFTPKILPISKKRPSSTLSEMTDKFNLKKENKIDKMRSQLINKELKECTFKPELNTKVYNKVKSRIKEHDKIYEDINKIEKDREREIEKLYAIIKECENCKFKPEINKRPNYLKHKK